MNLYTFRKLIVIGAALLGAAGLTHAQAPEQGEAGKH